MGSFVINDWIPKYIPIDTIVYCQSCYQRKPTGMFKSDIEYYTERKITKLSISDIDLTKDRLLCEECFQCNYDKTHTYKVCSICGENKLLSQYYLNGIKPRTSFCKRCNLEIARGRNKQRKLERQELQKAKLEELKSPSDNDAKPITYLEVKKLIEESEKRTMDYLADLIKKTE